MAVLVRIFIVFTFPNLRFPLTYEPEWIADNILAGRGPLVPHLGQEYLVMRPLFVYLSATVYWLTGHSHLAMLIVQAILSGLTVLVVFLIGWRLGGPVIARLAALFTALEPTLVYYDVTRIHPLGLEGMLLSLVLLTFFRLSINSDWTTFLLAGLAVGAAIYQRGTVVFFVPVGLVLVGYWHRLAVLHWIRLVLLFGLGALLILSPWLVRMYVERDKPLLVTTLVPELLWIGNNPNATGSMVTDSGQTMLEAAPEAFRAEFFAADEPTRRRLLWGEVRRFVTTYPWGTVTLFLKKVYYFWWFSPQAGREHPSWALPLYKPVYALALLAAVWGFIVGFHRENRDRFVLLLLFLLMMSFGQSLFYVEGRHRTALMPAMLLSGTVGILELVSRARRARAIGA